MWKSALTLGLMLATCEVFAQSRVYSCRDNAGHWVFQEKKCGEGLTDQNPAAEPPAAARTSQSAPNRPSRCESTPVRLVFADPALDGAEVSLVIARDDNGYQLLLQFAGVIERDDGPVPAQFSGRLAAQGLRFDRGDLITPDFRRGDKQLGYGYARTATVLDFASKSTSMDAEIEPVGYAQSMSTAPLASALLSALRSEMLRCHLLMQRTRAVDSNATREQQSRQ